MAVTPLELARAIKYAPQSLTVGGKYILLRDGRRCYPQYVIVKTVRAERDRSYIVCRDGTVLEVRLDSPYDANVREIAIDDILNLPDVLYLVYGRYCREATIYEAAMYVIRERSREGCTK